MKGLEFMCFACKGIGSTPQMVACAACGGSGKAVYAKQEDMVLARLRIGKLTDHQARDQLGITRLAAVIHRLRKVHEIASHEITVPNRFRNTCRIAEYELIRENNACASAELIRASREHLQPST